MTGWKLQLRSVIYYTFELTASRLGVSMLDSARSRLAHRASYGILYPEYIFDLIKLFVPSVPKHLRIYRAYPISDTERTNPLVALSQNKSLIWAIRHRKRITLSSEQEPRPPGSVS